MWARGFSLLEILVVLVIMSITFGFAVLAFGDFGSSRQAKVSAEQFFTYLQLVEEEAILERTSFSLRFHKQSYETFRLEHGEWKTLAQHSFFHRRTLKKPLEMVFKSSSSDEPLIISPNGLFSPFELTFSLSATKPLARIRATLQGELSFQSIIND